MPKRVLTGTIVSDKGDKTIVVRVERRVKHPLYGKIMRLTKKYHAHDAENAYREGEQVRIEECPPVSKLKQWTVIDRVGTGASLVTDTASDVGATKSIKSQSKAARAASASAA